MTLYQSLYNINIKAHYIILANAAKIIQREQKRRLCVVEWERIIRRENTLLKSSDVNKLRTNIKLVVI